jgi:hypothetical protein
MSVKRSTSGLPKRSPIKPAGPGGTPSAAPAGLVLPLARARADRRQPVRPHSIARFPGMLEPQDFSDIGGTAL